MGESGGNLVSHSFNQERCRKAVARMCIKDNQPFSIVEDEGFSELVWELNSEFELPSRWTVARDTLLELTDRDYASYFYNETEDGEEGTRMIAKTKKKKKNVVGVPNEDDWSNGSSQAVVKQCHLQTVAVRFGILARGEGLIDKYRNYSMPKTAQALIFVHKMVTVYNPGLGPLMAKPLRGGNDPSWTREKFRIRIDMFSNGKKQRNDSSQRQD
ncbi:zinc finger, BED-type containing protein [Tanacetum coccineum]